MFPRMFYKYLQNICFNTVSQIVSYVYAARPNITAVQVSVSRRSGLYWTIPFNTFHFFIKTRVAYHESMNSRIVYLGFVVVSIMNYLQKMLLVILLWCLLKVMLPILFERKHISGGAEAVFQQNRLKEILSIAS